MGLTAPDGAAGIEEPDGGHGVALETPTPVDERSLGAMPGREHQGGPAVVVNLVDAGTSLHQDPDHFGVAAEHRCEYQGVRPVPPLAWT